MEDGNENLCQQILNKLDEILERLPGKGDNEEGKSFDWIDNSDLIRLMKISARTAQTWRDRNLVAFSQVGSKIYYRKADIEKFLRDRYSKQLVNGSR